jgi:uncharacterized protein (DUF427 family)
MAHAPGYEKHPEHRIRQAHESRRVFAMVNGEIVAESSDAIRVEEDGSPVRYYFPRTDVNLNTLVRSDSTTHCPFKGTAHYYVLNAGGQKLRDAVWTYEDPYEEHEGLKDRLAFYDDRHPSITVRIAD